MPTNHSPLPWMRESFADMIFVTGDKSTTLIARVEEGMNRCEHQYEQTIANADFITRACNSHYGLLAAAETLLSLVNTSWENDAIHDLKSVIAKAKGESDAQ